MILTLFALGALLLVLPGLSRTPPARLPLSEWVPMATASLTVGALSVQAGLVLVAFPTVAHGVGLASLADACHQVLAPLSTQPGPWGWVAALAALIVATRFARGVLRARRAAQAARAEPWLGTHADCGDFDLVVVPTVTPLAFAAPGRPPQVVVSQGLMERVPPDALAAVVDHEAAHHRLRHDRYLTLLIGIERALGALRFVRRGTATIRAGLEAWADAAASHDHADRHALRRALAAVTEATEPGVGDRRRRLLRRRVPAPPALRAAWYAPAALLMIASALVVIGWIADAHPALAFGGTCA